MCGIAGIVRKNKKTSNELRYIKAMTDLLKHRGPDDEGFAFFSDEETVTAGGKDTPQQVWQSNYAYKPKHQLSNIEDKYHTAFGYRRLSIIDPSPAGHQPFCSKAGDIWMVYNGEIYNYIELKEELKTGYQFNTNTDTEVLLASYQKWGKECLHKFNGMWAFTIYDKNKNVLFGARDPFGVKPYYYYNDAHFFAFASEQKALVKLPFVHTGINNSAAFDYLIFGKAEHQEEGLFKNIFELPPAYCFELDLSNSPTGGCLQTFKKWKYTSLSYEKKYERFDENKFKTYTEQTKKLINNAIHLRLRSDVPVGACLSGGLDSSTIVCSVDKLLKEQNLPSQVLGGERQKVFTASFKATPIDESQWAEQVVQQTNTHWFQTHPKADELLQDFEDIVYTQDIPFFGSSTYAQYRVMRLVNQQGIKVTLDGQGGDELFTGYPPHYMALWVEMLKHFKYAKLIKEFNNTPNASDLFNGLKTIAGKKIAETILPSFFKEKLLIGSRPENKYISKTLWQQNRKQLSQLEQFSFGSLNKMLYEYFTGIALKNLLRTGDRNSMRFSVEARMPFADDVELIKYVFQIPSVYKIRDGMSKYLLRNATQGLVPQNIRLRKDKIGFATPEKQWFAQIKDELKTYLTNDLDEFVEVKKLQKDWEKLIQNTQTTTTIHLWRLINFALWKKVYNL